MNNVLRNESHRWLIRLRKGCSGLATREEATRNLDRPDQREFVMFHNHRREEKVECSASSPRSRLNNAFFYSPDQKIDPTIFLLDS